LKNPRKVTNSVYELDRQPQGAYTYNNAGWAGTGRLGGKTKMTLHTSVTTTSLRTEEFFPRIETGDISTEKEGEKI